MDSDGNFCEEEDYASSVAERGFAIVSSFASAQELDAMRSECAMACESLAKGMDAEDAVRRLGCVVQIPAQHGAGYKGSRERLYGACSAPVSSMIFGEKVKELLASLIGEYPVLFNEQYILKPPQCADSTFPWHRDDASMAEQDCEFQVPYVSLWIALDDMSRENGCLYALPYGKERGEEKPLRLNAGDVVILACDVWHRSEPNSSDFWRRAYMVQYSQEAIMTRSGAPVALAVGL